MPLRVKLYQDVTLAKHSWKVLVCLFSFPQNFETPNGGASGGCHGVRGMRWGLGVVQRAMRHAHLRPLFSRRLELQQKGFECRCFCCVQLLEIIVSSRFQGFQNRFFRRLLPQEDVNCLFLFAWFMFQICFVFPRSLYDLKKCSLTDLGIFVFSNAVALFSRTRSSVWQYFDECINILQLIIGFEDIHRCSLVC